MCSCPRSGVCFCVLCVCAYVFIVCIQCVSRPAHFSCVFLSSICSLTPRHPDRDPGSQLHLSQLHCTMGSLRPGDWPLILVHVLLLQIQPVKVQGADPVSHKLRRLNEQVGLNLTVCLYWIHRIVMLLSYWYFFCFIFYFLMPND